jgi:GAF domain-containing protein
VTGRATADEDRREHLERLRVLVHAGIALNSELSLDALLQRIVDTAAELTTARYAALAVIDRAGHGLERFFTAGIDPETYTAIGELPRGRGILGVLIRNLEPLRLHDIAEDPRSVGFPPNHPPMKTFLGLPIVLRDVAYGNLYLSEKAAGLDFTAEDEELTLLLAAQAAVAIENARLYESATRWLRQLETLNEIGNALSSEVELEPLLELVAKRTRELVGARIVLIALPDAQGSLAVAAVEGADADDVVGLRLQLSSTKVGRVLERGQTERVDAVVDDPEVDQRIARELGISSAIYLPLLVRGKAIGVVAAHDKLGDDPRFDEGDVRLAESAAWSTRRRWSGHVSRVSSTTRPGRRSPPSSSASSTSKTPWRPRRAARRRRRSASSSSRRSRTFAASRSSFGRARSTTSDWCQPSSGSRRRSPSTPSWSSTSRPGSASSGSQQRWRRRSTGSCRRG